MFKHQNVQMFDLELNNYVQLFPSWSWKVATHDFKWA